MAISIWAKSAASLSLPPSPSGRIKLAWRTNSCTQRWATTNRLQGQRTLNKLLDSLMERTKAAIQLISLIGSRLSTILAWSGIWEKKKWYTVTHLSQSHTYTRMHAHRQTHTQTDAHTHKYTHTHTYTLHNYIDTHPKLSINHLLHRDHKQNK